MEKLTEIPALPELTFDEGPHVYKLNGVVIPSVSQVMTPLRDAEYFRVDKKTLEKAADRGTAVHNGIENWLKFGFDDYPPEHKPYIDAFKDWYAAMKPEVVGSEVRMYHNLLKYAGTADLLCYINGELWLIDFKTTYKVLESTCGVQLEAYVKALETLGIKVNRKAILHLQKSGKFKVHEFPMNDAARWRVFGACKTVYDYVSAA